MCVGVCVCGGGVCMCGCVGVRERARETLSIRGSMCVLRVVGNGGRGRTECRHATDMEAELKNMNHSWGTIPRLASDRQGWRSFVAAL